MVFNFQLSKMELAYIYIYLYKNNSKQIQIVKGGFEAGGWLDFQSIPFDTLIINL